MKKFLKDLWMHIKDSWEEVGERSAPNKTISQIYGDGLLIICVLPLALLLVTIVFILYPIRKLISKIFSKGDH